MDMAGNVSHFTICYLYNKETKQFEIEVNQGLIECNSNLGVRLTLNVGNQITTVKPDFASYSLIQSEGRFRKTSISNYNLGFEADYLVIDKLEIFSAINLTSFNPVLKSSDTTIGSTRDPQTDELRQYREGNVLTINSSLISLDLGLKYHLLNNIHAKLALSPTITTSKKIKNEKEILTPDYLNFPSENGRELLFDDELDEINRINLLLNLGIEYRRDINDKYFWKSSLNYNLGLGSYINNGNLNVNNWSLIIGAGLKL